MNQTCKSRSLVVDGVAKLNIFCLNEGEGFEGLGGAPLPKLPLSAFPPLSTGCNLRDCTFGFFFFLEETRIR